MLQKQKQSLRIYYVFVSAWLALDLSSYFKEITYKIIFIINNHISFNKEKQKQK